MANRDILAIGTSAGGVEALLSLAKSLPSNLPAAVLITLHLPHDFKSVLDQLLSRVGPLPASFAEDGVRPRKGHIYIAPPNRHLLLIEDRLVLGSGARENNSRPAIDPMLRSVAACCGCRAIGVVLTGTLGDGASGLWAVSQCGGITVVQDPSDAAFAEMPLNALNRVRADHVVTLAAMPSLLESLVFEPAGEVMPAPETLRFELEVAKGKSSSVEEMDHHGRRSALACPDCHGVMWEFDEGELVRYRCHVGHTYTAELMAVAIDENLRRALGGALRALEERVALAKRLQRQAAERQQTHLSATWTRQADEAEAELKILRRAVNSLDRLAADEQQKNAVQNAAE